MDQVEKVQDRPKKRSTEDGPSPSVTVWEQCAKEVASLVREAALTGDQSEPLFNKALSAYVDLLKVSKVCKTIREAILAKEGGGGAAAAAAAESRGGQLTAPPAPAPAPVSGAIANQGGGSTAAAKTVLPSGLASCKAPLPLPPPPPPITTSVWPVSFLDDCHDYCYFSDRRRLRFGDDWYDSGEVYDDDDDEDEEEEEEDWLDYDEDEEEEEDWLDYDEDDEGGEDVEIDDEEVIDYSKSATSGSGNGSRHKRARH